MILLIIGLAALGAFLNAGLASFTPAAVNAVASVWGNGVMANYASDPQAAPNWAARVSMLTTAAAVVFIIIGLVAG